jgi:hypothetical protein
MGCYTDPIYSGKQEHNSGEAVATSRRPLPRLFAVRPGRIVGRHCLLA